MEEANTKEKKKVAISGHSKYQVSDSKQKNRILTDDETT
jgi:hypothetical protein